MRAPGIQAAGFGPPQFRLIFEVVRQKMGAGLGVLFTWRASVCGGMSNTAPPRNERSHLMCSACAQTKGIALLTVNREPHAAFCAGSRSNCAFGAGGPARDAWRAGRHRLSCHSLS
jgi:hypothetical protein